jgi:hypothetical protein
MTLFHRTTTAAAKQIIANGFRDSAGRYMTTGWHRGVWLSDRPLDSNQGADGDVLLCIVLSCSEVQIARWEWIEARKPYREWLIPAQTVNHLGTLLVVRESNW